MFCRGCCSDCAEPAAEVIRAPPELEANSGWVNDSLRVHDRIRAEKLKDIDEHRTDRADESLAGLFSIQLDTCGKPLGATFETTSSGILVRSVRNGPLRTHNVCSSNGCNVYANDFIVKVNALTNPQKMFECLTQAHQTLSLEIVHPTYISLRIDAKSQQLNLDWIRYGGQAEQPDVPPMFEITRIRPGAVKKYNSRCTTQDEMVQLKDRIIEVNGCGTDVGKMDNILTGKGLVEIKLLRVVAHVSNEIANTKTEV